ncbi:hypothetical protein Q5752_005240 [Cryptotrichosporon argae]
MVKLLVKLSMELEGVTNVRPADDDYEYFFTVMCTGCREVHPKTVSFNRQEEHELSGSRGSAHFVWRCQSCKKEHSASFIPPSPSSKSTAPLAYSARGPAAFVALDCRGLEFVAFYPRGRWAAEGAGAEGPSGERFEFELEDGRWDDYDEKQGEAVSVSEVLGTVGRM